jgi:methyl-accepting chemotaxis protein
MKLMTIINNLKLNSKMLILALTAVVAVAAPTVLFISATNDEIEAASLEIIGVEAANPFKVIQLVQQHRGLAAGALAGNLQQMGQLQKKAQEAGLAFQELQSNIKSLNNGRLDSQVVQLRTEWESIVTDLKNQSLDAKTSFANHTSLIDGLFDFLWRVGAHTNLWYDPQVETYHLIIANLESLPKVTESLGQMRAKANVSLINQNLTLDSRHLIAGLKAVLVKEAEAFMSNMEASAVSDEELAQLLERGKSRFRLVDQIVSQVDREILNSNNFTLAPAAFFDQITQVIDGLFEFNREARDVLKKKLHERIDTLQTARNTTLGILALLVIVGAALGFLIVRSLIESVRSVVSVTQKISKKEFELSLDAERRDEFGQLNKAMLAMSQQLKKADELAVENARIRQSLEGASVNVMIADNARNIIYMNTAVTSMLRESESDIREALPNFSVDRTLGSNMDIFHKKPSHQAELLEKLSSAYEAQIQVGRRHFRLTANPIKADNGERLGTVVEWLDRTQEVAIEQEIAALVEAAAAGKFGERISSDNKEGFDLNLANGLNQVMETVDRGLQDIARVLGAMADGDLTRKIESEYHGQFAELKNASNKTVSNLAEMINGIREAVETINTASCEIASGNSDLSSRTEQQAANLEETASSMEQLTGTVRLNADNAKQATGLASQAANVAVEGGELIGQVVQTMSTINESAQKIADIIGVIDSIAFQTNILALNAAVEAARAGDQGRGFAVVASEVRTLAQSSANAAKDIKSLISDSVQKIADGNELVNRSGNTMKDVVDSIKRVNDIMAEIAAASSEQASGIDEIGKAVSQMDEMTQQNAALVEEAAAAAESLQSQAHQLSDQVATFRLDETYLVQASARQSLSDNVRTNRKEVTGFAEKRAVAPARQVPRQVVQAAKPEEDEWEDF